MQFHHRLRLTPQLLLSLLLIVLPACEGLHVSQRGNQIRIDYVSQKTRFAQALKDGDFARVRSDFKPAYCATPIGGKYPVECAVQSGRADIANFLLAHGNNPRFARSGSNSLAYQAASRGRSDFARQLVSQGYGHTSDVANGLAEKRRSDAASLAVAGGFLWLLGNAMSGDSGSNDSHKTCEYCLSVPVGVGQTYCADCRGIIYLETGY